MVICRQFNYLQLEPVACNFRASGSLINMISFYFKFLEKQLLVLGFSDFGIIKVSVRVTSRA